MLIFLDLQTTGFEKEDKICSLGCLLYTDGVFQKSHYMLFNEGKKIPSSASALHNITNEMIKDKKSFYESEIYTILKELNTLQNTLIVHNNAFVLDVLKRSGLTWRGKIIDSQRVVKHSIAECENFTLQFLRYELQLYKNEKSLQKVLGIKGALIAHHALSNAIMIKLLFDYLDQEINRETMYDMSFESVLLEKFPFGKYAGRYIEEIAMNDQSYLHWMLSLESLDDDLRYSLEYYLKG